MTGRDPVLQPHILLSLLGGWTLPGPWLMTFPDLNWGNIHIRHPYSTSLQASGYTDRTPAGLPAPKSSILIPSGGLAPLAPGAGALAEIPGHQGQLEATPRAPSPDSTTLDS